MTRQAKKDLLVELGRGELLGGGDVMEPKTGCNRRSSAVAVH